jgi:hypothetical protein
LDSPSSDGFIFRRSDGIIEEEDAGGFILIAALEALAGLSEQEAASKE